jgi:hypothetical protein
MRLSITSIAQNQRPCIDTVKLKIPVTEEWLATKTNQTLLKDTLNVGTGEVTKQSFLNILIGMSIVFCSVRRYETHRKAGEHTTRRYACPAYLCIEISLPKAMCGHNVYGGPTRWLDSMWWLWGELDDPGSYPEEWRVERIDIARAYSLGSLAAVLAWFDANRNVTYPRRNVALFNNWESSTNGFSACSKTTKTMGYSKGLKYRQDKTKEPVYVTKEEKAYRQEIADGILRTEVSLLPDKLQYDFEGYPYVGQIEDDYLYLREHAEFKRMFGEQDRSRVNDSLSLQAIVDRIPDLNTVAVFLADRYHIDVFHTTCAKTIRTHRAKLRKMGIQNGVNNGQQFMPGRYEYLDTTVNQTVLGCQDWGASLRKDWSSVKTSVVCESA